jgi:hypothetical protein
LRQRGCASGFLSILYRRKDKQEQGRKIVKTLDTKRIARRATCLWLAITMCLNSLPAFAQNPSAQPSTQANAEQSFPSLTGSCDKSCLVQTMQAFFTAAVSHRFEKVPAIQSAEIRENARIIALSDSTWAKVRAIRSTLVFADAVTGYPFGNRSLTQSFSHPSNLQAAV